LSLTKKQGIKKARIERFVRATAIHLPRKETSMSLTALVHILTASEPPTLWEEIKTYIIDKYFTLNWHDYNYSYLSVSDNGLVSVRTVVVGILIGVILAAAMAVYQKRTLGDLVRAIDREWCVTPESAKTLTELGLIRSTAIKSDLRFGHSLRRVVRCVEEEAHNAACTERYRALREAADNGDAEAAATLKKWKDVPFRQNFETDHFYIPERLIYGAEYQFEKKGTTPLTLLTCIVVCIILMIAICFFLPELLQMTDNMIGALFG
jgi:cell division protein FtsL